MSRSGLVGVLFVSLLVGCSDGTPTPTESMLSSATPPDLGAAQSNPDNTAQFYTFSPSGVLVELAASTGNQPVQQAQQPVDQNPFTVDTPTVNTTGESTGTNGSSTTQSSPVDENENTEDENAITQTPALTSAPTSLAETVVVAEEPQPTVEESQTTVEDQQSTSEDTPDIADTSPQGNEPAAPSTPEVEGAGAIFPESEKVISKTIPSSDLSSPQYKKSVNEIYSNIPLTRISSADAFSGDTTHQYSKRQVWNSQETLMEIGDSVVDASDLSIINPFIPISTGRNWSNLDADTMYGIRYNPDPNEFVAANIRTNDIRLIRKFSDYNRCSLGNSEGNLSNDDARVVLACDERSSGARILISYDIAEDKILGTLNAASNYNWAGFSQSGDYIVVENNKYPDNNAHIIVYTPEFQSGRNLGSPGHGDFGYDDNGDEVYVMIRGDVIWYVRLHDGYKVNLSISNDDNPIGHGHISCRNLQRPGWCYFSAHKESRIGAVRISDSNSVVEHWGFHRSSFSSYNAEPKASVSRSGTQIVFTSDWFGSQDISDFRLRLP